MRIALDGRFYRSSTAGIGRYTRELVKNLLAVDQQNEYILFITPADVDECTIEASNLKKVITPITHFTFAEQLKLTSVIQAEKPDLTHFLNFNHPLQFPRPFITTIHDLTMNFFPVKRQRMPILRQAYLYTMAHAAKAADAVIVPTSTVKDDVVQHLKAKPEKIEVIYEGVEIPEKLPARPSATTLAKIGITKPYILFVSQWRPHKGLGVLVEAFNEIKKKHDIQLVITGKPNAQFPEIPSAIDASPQRTDIITPGFVDDKLLDQLYLGTELFIFPSWYEGFGLPPLEAMARKVAVAASNSSVMPEVLGEGAVYFDARDSHDTAKVISETLSDSKLIEELKQKGFQQAQKYSWRKMAEETLELYEKIYSTHGQSN